MATKDLVADAALVGTAGYRASASRRSRAQRWAGLFGFTPRPQRYPLVSHLRGFAGHPLYGLGVAALVEAGWKATGRR